MITRKLILIGVFSALIINQIQAVKFNPDSVYTRWIIQSRMGDFRNRTSTEGFLTPNNPRSAGWDYVAGLVAKSILKSWEYYQSKPEAAMYLRGIQDFADNTKMVLAESNLDDLNAAKIYFELYRASIAKGDTARARIYKERVTGCRNLLRYKHNRIPANLPGAGGFWHKKQYVNQMWLDGLYMGAAFYAEWQGNFGKTENKNENDKAWSDIALQFDTIYKYTRDNKAMLNYHAWSAEPGNAASAFWANPATGRSQEFWARGMGWFFAALVDVLEYMPQDHPARKNLVRYTREVAQGLARRQDARSGCWYQLLQYDATKKGTGCNISNYLESSASCMFTYAYLKGMRLGILNKKQYQPVATKAYKGIVENFIVKEKDGKIKIIQSCESAGLSNTRKGDANYYLCGSDVAINNNTEGKVLGPFIMASLEYEMQHHQKKTTLSRKN